MLSLACLLALAIKAIVGCHAATMSSTEAALQKCYSFRINTKDYLRNRTHTRV